MENKKNLLKRLRYTGIAEGISFLILLLIAMPLKYIFHKPEFVLVFGWIHGALFVTYGYFVIRAWAVRKWSFKKAFRIGIASVIPMGTFYTDKEIKAEENSL